MSRIKSIGGIAVIDGKRSEILEITKSDVDRSDPKRPEACAAARAICRELHAVEAAMRKLTVLLSPSGSLLVELPGSNGPRTVGLRVGFEGETLRRLLSHAEGAIDSPGSPTRSRALHTQYHRESPVETCPFCKEDGMIVRELESKWRNLGEGVQVRRLKPKSKKEDLMKMDLDF